MISRGRVLTTRIASRGAWMRSSMEPARRLVSTDSRLGRATSRRMGAKVSSPESSGETYLHGICCGQYSGDNMPALTPRMARRTSARRRNRSKRHVMICRIRQSVGSTGFRNLLWSHGHRDLGGDVQFAARGGAAGHDVIQPHFVRSCKARLRHSSIREQ